MAELIHPGEKVEVNTAVNKPIAKIALIGNFPGVTVDKKTGVCHLTQQQKARIIDLPGTYSLYPKSLDEKVIIDLLYNRKSEFYPDLIIVTADASNLKRNLLLYT